MVRAIDLLRQSRSEELWQMCCGFLSLSMQEFMDIQESLLLEQLDLLNNCPLGEKITRGRRPQTVQEFRDFVPLTTYEDYYHELSEKREDILPVKPAIWAHSSGKTGEYPCKWVPITEKYARELSQLLYGVGILSSCQDWGDTSRIPKRVKLLYSVARKPYISGTFADILRMQTPLDYMPTLEESENLTFEERLKLGFSEAMSQGLHFFFGLSLVLVMVGNKFQQSSEKTDVKPYLLRPKALWRLLRGVIRSRMAGRPLLPKDIWTVRGIIGSGVDSSVYKNKIKELWGRHPLDLYSSTEGGVIATQTWDYEGMTFVPNLNFLEFIPEEEHFKWQLDRSYQPETVLLNEVEAGKNYELVLTNFHGGILTRYRIGDMIRIESLRDDKLGIKLPQISFERRADDLIDFNVIRLTEKVIWRALEKSGIDYEDWMAYKKPGEQTLQLLLEPRNGYRVTEEEAAEVIYNKIAYPENDDFASSEVHEDLMDMVGFSVNVSYLPEGTFARYTAQKQAEGADIAHLKPPHINPSSDVLTLLVVKPEKTPTTTGEETGVETITAQNR
jgi:hypothetical protein